MGVVYEAHDPALERTVALKTIHPQQAAIQEDRAAYERRFYHEAKVAARLSHPGIIVVHEFGHDEATDILYIALERLQGETLAEIIRRGERLPWAQALEITRQVAEALHHAHEQGVVHRDVKPANVMLLPSGQVKLMDFGIARLEAVQLTATGQSLGTPLYMSPEQAMNEPVDARGDIFTLGAVLYALLTGRHAFAAQSIGATVQRVINEDPTLPSQVNPDLPGAVDGLVARCLAKAPDDRYPDARALADDIALLLEWRPPHDGADAPPTGWAPSAVPSGRSARPSPPGEMTRTVGLGAASRRRRQWIGALVAGALLLAAAGLWTTPARSRILRLLTPVLAPSLAPPPSPDRATVAESPPDRVGLPARMVVDLRHPLKSGTLHLWVDDEEVLGRPVRGTVTRDLLAVKLREGVFTQVLEVEPGRHVFRVEVSWDEESRSRSIQGRLQRGETYRLEIRLSRLGKDLSLRWTR